MAWYAVYETATGALVSVGPSVASPLPVGLTAAALASEPTPAEMWDAASRLLIARPAKVLVDRLTDLVADADFRAAWDTLSDANKQRVRTALIRFLGPYRYRSQSSGVTLDG